MTTSLGLLVRNSHFSDRPRNTSDDREFVSNDSLSGRSPIERDVTE